MGSVTAIGLADTTLDLETQLRYHLQGNHYPPVPVEMVAPCIEAIDAAYDEDYERVIDMPMVGDFQILYRGETQAPARAIVDQHHLNWFIQPAEDIPDEWIED
jgi:hypothetical protein